MFSGLDKEMMIGSRWAVSKGFIGVNSWTILRLRIVSTGSQDNPTIYRATRERNSKTRQLKYTHPKSIYYTRQL